MELHPIEVRVLGSLLEKEITTPEYYPLSLNALVNACNQKSNRDPVVHFDEETVERVLSMLRDKGLVLNVTGAGQPGPEVRTSFVGETEPGPARAGYSVRADGARSPDAG